MQQHAVFLCSHRRIVIFIEHKPAGAGILWVDINLAAAPEICRERKVAAGIYNGFLRAHGEGLPVDGKPCDASDARGIREFLHQHDEFVGSDVEDERIRIPAVAVLRLHPSHVQTCTGIEYHLRIVRGDAERPLPFFDAPVESLGPVVQERLHRTGEFGPERHRVEFVPVQICIRGEKIPAPSWEADLPVKQQPEVVRDRHHPDRLERVRKIVGQCLAVPHQRQVDSGSGNAVGIAVVPHIDFQEIKFAVPVLDEFHAEKAGIGNLPDECPDLRDDVRKTLLRRAVFQIAGIGIVRLPEDAGKTRDADARAPVQGTADELVFSNFLYETLEDHAGIAAIGPVLFQFGR